MSQQDRPLRLAMLTVLVFAGLALGAPYTCYFANSSCGFGNLQPSEGRSTNAEPALFGLFIHNRSVGRPKDMYSTDRSTNQIEREERMVGLISHIERVPDRIPEGLEVVKGSGMSHVRSRAAASVE